MADNDRPYRVIFPDPLILHGTDPAKIRERALEYLKHAGEIRVEPLHEPMYEPKK